MTTFLGTALAQHIELTESISSQGAGVEAPTLKLDALKAKLAGEKLKLAKLKDAAKRRKELAQVNKRSAARPTANENKQNGMVTLRAASGRVIGCMRVMGPNQTGFFSASGMLVAREVGGATYDHRGRAILRGHLSHVALGGSPFL